ncbi:hypothetical protein V8G54_037906 (chloroplast) [Vigna mungo]|uniref:Transmembrane protein n=1 Tax=Vigna mungo TaxID=3915 RepID=A0AAQ3REU2_VIGMU
MAFHYSLFLSREGSSSSPADPLFMWQCDAAERKPLGSKISLSPPLPVSILVDSLLPSSRKRLVRPFCVAFFSPCFGRPIWLVQLSLLEAPAVVRLRTPHRCLPGGIGAPEGGLRSLLSLRPSIPFKLDPALRLVTLFAHLKTRWLRALFGRNPAKTDCYWLLCLSILLWPAWRHRRKTVISIRDYPRSGEKTECIPMDSKGERRTEWRMEADRLERGLAGREVRFLPDSYLLDPLFPCSCLRLNDTSRKQTTGRTRAGVDAREGTGAEAAGIGQRVGRLGKRWLTLICLSTTMVVIIAMACTVACSMVPSLCCWPTTDRYYPASSLRALGITFQAFSSHPNVTANRTWLTSYFMPYFELSRPEFSRDELLAISPDF